MTLWARNDIMSVTIPGHFGGCGQLHVRPEGEATWGLSCAGGCEEFLRTDALWAPMPEKIMETPDETQQREAAEQHVAKRSLLAIDHAAGLLAALTGPRDLLLGGQNAIAAGPPCRKCGASVSPAARFCSSCGSPHLQEITGQVVA